jgi:hypothetical protein
VSKVRPFLYIYAWMAEEAVVSADNHKYTYNCQYIARLCLSDMTQLYIILCGVAQFQSIANGDKENVDHQRTDVDSAAPAVPPSAPPTKRANAGTCDIVYAATVSCGLLYSMNE